MNSKVCTQCKVDKPWQAYAFRSRKTKALASECKSCHNNKSKRKYKTNTKQETARVSKHREHIRQWFDEYKSNLKCSLCPENFGPALHFHHKDPETKVKGVTRLVSDCASKKRILAEIAKCVVLCANCHSKVENGFIKLAT